MVMSLEKIDLCRGITFIVLPFSLFFMFMALIYHVELVLSFAIINLMTIFLHEFFYEKVLEEAKNGRNKRRSWFFMGSRRKT